MADLLTTKILTSNHKQWFTSAKSLKTWVIALLLVAVAFVPLFFTDSSEDFQDIRQYEKSGQNVVVKRVVYNPFQVISSDSSEPLDPSAPSAFSHYLEVVPDQQINISVSSLDSDLYAFPDSTENRMMSSRLKAIMDELHAILQKHVDYYSRNGHWPETVASPAKSLIPDIRRISSRSSGEIRVYLENEFGMGKVIRLTPRHASSVNAMSWFCQTNVSNIWLGKGKNRLCIYNERIQ